MRTVKKVESTNSRLHGICVVGRLPKVTDAHGKRFPCTERQQQAGTCTSVRNFEYRKLKLGKSCVIKKLINAAQMQGRDRGAATGASPCRNKVPP
jgi:hypothetical protein